MSKGFTISDIESMPLDDEATWNLIQSGKTKGIFQLESNLGRHWCKEIKPSTIEELAAIISLVRPGCLKALTEGKSMTQHYADRKNGTEDTIYYHPDMKQILGETYGILCIHEDTYISMSDGTEQQIKFLKPKDNLISLNITNNLLENDTCFDIKKSPKRNGFKLTLKNGFSVKLTKDHKVSTQRGWIEVQDLDIQKDVVQIAIQQSIYKQSRNIQNYDYIHNNQEYVSYLCGQLLGDGCSGECLASGTKEHHDKLYKWLINNFNTTLNIKERFHGRSWYIDISGKELLNDTNYGNRKTKYRLFIESLKLDKTKHDKIIDNVFFQLSSNNRHAFLAGLLDSDGHISESKTGHCIINYCSSNPQIINGIRKLLSLDGIEHIISKDGLHIYISNTEKFVSLIGPYLIVKSPVGNLLTAKTYGDFPNTLLKERAYNLGYTNLKKFAKDNNIAPSSIVGARFINIQTAKKAGYEFGNTSFSKIHSITEITNQNFYSISVSNNHNLIGNGICIKNCYQEQAMELATHFAGFTLQQADLLRKAMGKKKADIMAQVKTEFMDGCNNVGILNKEQAEEVFSWIEKSQRYSFNKSHAVSYAVTGYWSAWIKKHYPLEFYCSYMRFALRKPKPMDEIKMLVSDARLFNIEVLAPKFVGGRKIFYIDGDAIRFGLSNIKGIGDAAVKKIREFVADHPDVYNMTWVEFIVKTDKYISKTVIENMIQVGAFDHFGMGRNQMLYEYHKFARLTKTEKAFILTEQLHNKSLIDVLKVLGRPKKEGGGASNKNRVAIIQDIIKSLEQPPFNLDDTNKSMREMEETLLGIAITPEFSTFDINTSCKELTDGNIPSIIVLSASVDECRKYTITKEGKNFGRNMAYLRVHDDTGWLENLVVFPDVFENYEDIFEQESSLLLICKYNNRRGQDSFVVEKVEVL